MLRELFRVFEAADAPGGQIRLTARTPRRKEMMGVIDWRMMQCEDMSVVFHFNTLVGPNDVLKLSPDLVIIATGGVAQNQLYETQEHQPHLVTAWDILSGDIVPSGNVLIYDEAGDHAGLQAAEVALQAGARVEIMTPDRTFAPEVMAMNLVPYMKTLQHDNVTFTVTKRLFGVERAGNRLRAAIGTDYSDRVKHSEYDQIVLNYGTVPLCDVYLDLRKYASNGGAVDYQALIDGKPQSIRSNPNGKFQLFRIGDAVSARNTHAAIYDALRLMKDT